MPSLPECLQDSSRAFARARSVKIFTFNKELLLVTITRSLAVYCAILRKAGLGKSGSPRSSTQSHLLGMSILTFRCSSLLRHASLPRSVLNRRNISGQHRLNRTRSSMCGKYRRDFASPVPRSPSNIGSPASSPPLRSCCRSRSWPRSKDARKSQSRSCRRRAGLTQLHGAWRATTARTLDRFPAHATRVARIARRVSSQLDRTVAGLA